MRLFLKILPFVFAVLIAHVKGVHARFSYALQENKFGLSLELEAKELQEEIRIILPKLASYFSSKAAVSVIGESGATVIERFAEAGADDIAFSVMAKYEVLVTPATKGFLAQSILAQGMKQGLNYADDAAKGGMNLVYHGLDGAGTVKYVGIAERAAGVRFAEHLNSGTAKSLLDFEIVPGATGLSRTGARVWEQTLINQYGLGKNGGQLLNKVNSIAPKYWWQYGIK